MRVIYTMRLKSLFSVLIDHHVPLKYDKAKSYHYNDIPWSNSHRLSIEIKLNNKEFISVTAMLESQCQ